MSLMGPNSRCWPGWFLLEALGEHLVLALSSSGHSSIPQLMASGHIALSPSASIVTSLSTDCSSDSCDSI